MHELEIWLRSKDRSYKQGVHLYSLYGKYPSVLALLQKEETQLTHAKLKEVLRDTWEAVKGDIATRVEAAKQFEPAPAGKPEGETDNTEETDAFLISLDKKWKPKYGEMAMLHARLGMCTTNEQRYNLALKITDLEAEILALWRQRDEYKRTGKEPAKPKKKVTKAKELSAVDHAKLTNLRSYVSRMEKKVLPDLEKAQLDKPTKRRAARITENLEKLANWKKEINELEHG